MTSVETWLERIQALSTDKQFQIEVAQMRAKALLKEVTDDVPEYKWTYVPSTVIRNATGASIIFEAISRTQPQQLKTLETIARQVALLWESVGKLGERVSSETATMNAAVAYELSGYQANASCLARRLVVHASQLGAPSLESLTSVFLQRFLVRTRQLTKRTRQEPDQIQGIDNSVVKAAALAFAGEGFDNASRYLLTGMEENLSKATSAFLDSQKIYGGLGAILESNLVLSMRSLLPVMQMRSTWTHFSGLVKDNARWERYLKLLARGIGDEVLNSPSVSELWPSQVLALSSGLLDPSKSKIIRMPTSAGKTRVAELAMVHILVTEPGSKCVYVAPYRALVWELEQSFLNLFGDLGFQVSTVVGTYESDEFEELIASDADILVLTPEKLDLLQRAQPSFLNNVRLFIMDEGQIVHDRDRGVKFELLLTRLKLRLPNARFLLLSAVVPQETLEDFARWFNADPNQDVVVSRWRPSIQRYSKFQWQRQGGVIRYVPSEDIPILNEFVSGVITERLFEFKNPKTARINRKRFPDPNVKSQTAAELAFKFAERGPVLVFCALPSHVEAVGKALEKRLNYFELTEHVPPSHIPRSPSLGSVLTSEEWLGNDHLVTRLLKRGVAIHHGDLPEAVKKTIERDFRERQLKILIATNTLAQGVNLPIRTVVVHGCRRRTSEGQSERITASDYWNIAGRAGRAGAETEGLIIHIVLTPMDELDFQYYLGHRDNVEPIKGALYGVLSDLVNNRLSEDEARKKLDPEILAILVEEGLDSLSQETIDKILNGSLVSVQTSGSLELLPRLKNTFKETADEITSRSPNRTYWPVYSATGLRTESCETLRKYVIDHKDALLNLLTVSDERNFPEFVKMCLDACVLLPEMQPTREFGGSYEDLLMRWLSGKGIREIIEEFKDEATSVEDLGKFIEEFFCYELPWGISAFVKIAAEVLELEFEKLPDMVRFTPSMIKIGVSAPPATWAFSAGIPFRSAAQKAGAKYLGQSPQPNYKDFSRWIKTINPEDLQYQFGLKGPVLREVSKALSRFGTNELLKNYTSLDDFLPRETWVRGIEHEEERIIHALGAQKGDPIELVRDYDNSADRNAIQLHLKGHQLGFVERELAQVLAVEIDAGLALSGMVTEIEEHAVRQIRVRIADGSNHERSGSQNASSEATSTT